MPFEIRSSFMGNFKLGDNINYNLDSLALLYEVFDVVEEDQRQLLRKPMIIALVSITEAVLHDFHKRIQTFTLEGVQNVALNVIDYVWPAPGSEDTQLGVLMEPEVDHGEAEVYTRVQA